MEWFALIVPLLVSIFLFILFKKNVTWWELLIPAAASALFILIFKFSVKAVMVHDTEAWGSMVTEARYYEYWSTWVSRTCTEQYQCGSDSKGNPQYCTRTYDCSYCDEHQPYWEVYDNAGNSWTISANYFEELKNRWHASPQFVNMNRSIDQSGSCGQDGNMYSIKWDGKPETSDAAVTFHSFTNKVQASHSAFRLPYVSKEEAQKNGLYEYPEAFGYKQRAVLGLEQLYKGDSLETVERLYQWFNGTYGPKNKVKLWVCLFYDKPQSISHMQEAYWSGGKQNELVICIGLNRATRQLQWVRPFSWTNDKRLLVDIREDIMNQDVFQPMNVWNYLKNRVNGDQHRSFRKDFAYLDVDLPTWSFWVIWIVTLLITVGASLWALMNDFDNEAEKKYDPQPERRWVTGKDGYTRRLPYRNSGYGYERETFHNKFRRRMFEAWEQLNKK